MFSGQMRKWLLRIGIAVVALVVAVITYGYFRYIRLPKPQITSAVGQVAPDFTLPDQDGAPVRLSSFRGHRVLLMFYRGAW
jgi:cytochrome oxidase Cu insertion factor (SCO1/SenC/PrrC family)